MEEGALHHRGSRRLAQGRVVGAHAVAALVQPVARGVQREVCRVLIEVHADDGTFPALVEGGDAEPRFEALRDGFFDDAARRLHRHERALDTFSVHQDMRVCGEKFLPRERRDAFKERIKIRGGKTSHPDEHAFARAQKDVEAGDVLPVPFERNSSENGGAFAVAERS